MACLVCWVGSIIAEPLSASLTLALAMANSVVLMRLCYKTNMTRTMSYMPMLMYLLPISVVPWLHTCWSGQIACMALLLCDIQLIGTYRLDNAAEPALLSTLLICLGGFACHDMIFFIPLLWLFFMFQQSFNLKVFLSSLIAIAVVVIYMAVVVWLSPDMLGYIIEPSPLSRQLMTLSAENWTIVAAMLMSLVMMVSALMRFSRESVSVQTYITFCSVPLVAIIVLVIWQSAVTNICGLLFMTLAMFATHFFLAEQNLVRGIAFVVYVVVLLSGYAIYEFL